LDEPEANINPKYIPVLAELLIMLESEGVQVFVSTHDYFLARYIEVKRGADIDVQYISLYKEEDNTVMWETAEEFELLKQNSIMDTFSQLCREEIWGIDVAFLNEQLAGKYKLTCREGKNDNLLQQAIALYEHLLDESDWPTVTILDIAEKVAMGPFGSNIKVSTFAPAGIPITRFRREINE